MHEDNGTAGESAGCRGRRAAALARAMRLQALLRRLAGLLCLSARLALWCSPASALSQRGHLFASSFAKKGSGAGELSSPSGVAVNETSGDVYVVDAGNDRVERFDPNGYFIGAWGWGVSDGKAEFETCTSVCQCGHRGLGRSAAELARSDRRGQLEQRSEDPSAGDVYVVADAQFPNAVIDKFTATGQFIGRLTSTTEAEAFGRIDGVSDGRRWVGVGRLGIGASRAVQRREGQRTGVERGIRSPLPGRRAGGGPPGAKRFI